MISSDPEQVWGTEHHTLSLVLAESTGRVDAFGVSEPRIEVLIVSLAVSP